MKTIEPLDQDELSPEMPSNGNLKALKTELETRCKLAKIPIEDTTDAKNGEFELLLPFSKEAEQLSHDIDLAQFLAQQVLIAASSPLKP